MNPISKLFHVHSFDMQFPDPPSSASAMEWRFVCPCGETADGPAEAPEKTARSRVRLMVALAACSLLGIVLIGYLGGRL